MTLLDHIRATFRDLPIRRKLRLIFVLTTAAALLLAGLGIIVADVILFYNYLERDLRTFVGIIGDNSTGALAFQDQKAGEELLRTLQARSHVETACLFERDGRLLARYQRADFSGSCNPENREEVHPEGVTLIAAHMVRLDNMLVGQLVVRYDLGEIWERLEIYGLVVLLALILSCLLTLSFSTNLRAVISQPILDLAAVAARVSRSRDYKIRARVRSADEMGALAVAVNQMMEAIENRDIELQKALSDQVQTADHLQLLNDRLNRSNVDLARSNSDLERFAFMVSHDLQEPLRMVTSYSQLLVTEGLQEGGDPAQFVEYILTGTKRMRMLLADLLSYLEISSANEPSMENVDVNLVAERVCTTLRARIEETGTEITFEQLPVLNAHANRIESLLQNLIENAIKYRSDREPRIHIRYRPGPDYLTIGVADNGIGIEDAYRDRIFVAFQRLHGKEVPGTGIGLAICQRIMERYGGRIWVESEFGRGSTFWFSFPASMGVETGVNGASNNAR